MVHDPRLPPPRVAAAPLVRGELSQKLFLLRQHPAGGRNAAVSVALPGGFTRPSATLPPGPAESAELVTDSRALGENREA